MLNSRFGYSMKKNSFKGLNIDCIQYSNIIRITYYLYSYSGTILNPSIIRIRIRPNIWAQILFVFVIAHSEKTNIIRIPIRSKFWFRIIFVFVFGPKNSIRSHLCWEVTYHLLYRTGIKLAIIWWHKHKHEQATVKLWRLVLQDHKREVKLTLVPCGLLKKRSVTFFIYMCSLTKLSTFDISKFAHDRLTAI